MAENHTNLSSSNQDAIQEYKTGMDQIVTGSIDAALTSFRRAVIADPNFMEAQRQIGLICKDKSKQDRMFLRYAYEAFRTVARLDPSNQTAHDQYILSAQEYGRLEDLHNEYEALARQNPSNELFQRCYKNIITLEMAMMPQKVDVVGAKASSNMRRATLFISLATILLGLSLVFLPVLFRKSTTDASKFSGAMKAGMTMAFVGLGGIFVYTKMR